MKQRSVAQQYLTFEKSSIEEQRKYEMSNINELSILFCAPAENAHLARMACTKSCTSFSSYFTLIDGRIPMLFHKTRHPTVRKSEMSRATHACYINHKI